MITKNIKRYLLAGSVCCAMGTALTACSDWNDHYEGTDAGAGAGASLWQQLKSDGQLSDFCDVLEQTKVYRMHKKTPVSYADLLKGGQSFTVLAPVNNTFNKDSLLQLVQTVAGDSSVEKSFVQNHLSRSLVSLTADSVRMMMLNTKRLNMVGGKVEGINISSANHHSSNGVFHLVDHAVNYNRNLYEMFCDDPQLAPIGKGLSRFNEDIFDPDASVSNGVIEGVPVYIDSVVYERNRLLDRIGLLKDEDSTYVAVAPAAQAWADIYAEAETYFQFDETVEKRDSLQQFYTMCALLEDGIFNMTNQKAPNDSLISVPYLRYTRSYQKGKKTYHVFYDPFKEGGILYGAQPLSCSNGTLYKAQKWPFTPEQTYFKEIFAEGESQGLVLDYDDQKCVIKNVQVNADSISEGWFNRITNKSGTDNWFITYQINNTLSGDYDICAVVLPKSVDNLTNPDKRPNKFKATLTYIDTDGKQKTYNCETEEKKSEFTNNPELVDTVVLARGFHFPACNYEQNNSKITLTITCSITARQTSQYSREMYLDCIYLRPRTSKSEEQ